MREYSDLTSLGQSLHVERDRKLLAKQLAFDEAVKELEYFYFLPAPEHLAYSHHPDNPVHQLLANPVPTAQFRKWPILKPVCLPISIQTRCQILTCNHNTRTLEYVCRHSSNAA